MPDQQKCVGRLNHEFILYLFRVKDTFLTEELNIKDNINDLNHCHKVMRDEHNIGEFKLNLKKSR